MSWSVSKHSVQTIVNVKRRMFKRTELASIQKVIRILKIKFFCYS